MALSPILPLLCGSLDRDYQSFHCPIPSIKPFKAKLKATLIQAPVSKEDNVFTLSTKVFWGQSEVACQNCYFIHLNHLSGISRIHCNECNGYIFQVLVQCRLKVRTQPPFYTVKDPF